MYSFQVFSPGKCSKCARFESVQQEFLDFMPASFAIQMQHAKEFEINLILECLGQSKKF